MTRASLIICGLAAFLVAIIAVTGGAFSASADASYINTLAIDTSIAGNTPTTIGPIDTCASLSVGQSVDVDVVVDAIPPLSGGGGGIFGFGFDILYDPTVVQVTAKADLATTSLIASGGNAYTPYSFTDASPDTDGDYQVAEADGSTNYESGAGTIIRLTLTAIGAGTSQLHLDDIGGGDFVPPPDVYAADTQAYSIAHVRDAQVVVGGDCPVVTPVPADHPSITGLITDVDGSPLAGASVQAVIFGCCQDVIQGSAISDSDGRYLITGLEGNFYQVKASAPGYFATCYARTRDCINPTAVHVDQAQAATVIDFVLRKVGEISGKVTDETTGEPIQGICVSASSGGGPGAVTDSLGNYTLDYVLPGDHVIVFYSCHQPEQYRTEFYDDAPSADEATYVSTDYGSAITGIDAALLKWGSISGTITNTSGEPIEGLCVSNWYGSPSASTDSSGRYTVGELYRGSYDIVFTDCNHNPRRYPDASVHVDLAPGQDATGVDLTIQSFGSISGTVTDETTGDPIKGLCVGANGSSYVSGSDQTDETGAYTIDGLSAGDYNVQFIDCGSDTYRGEFFDDQQNYWDSQLVAVSLGHQTTGIDAALTRWGTISGTVTDEATGQPLENICVDAYGGPSYASTITNAGGTYTLRRLDSGSYTVTFEDCQTGAYAAETYDNRQPNQGFDLIPVSLNQDVTGIDAGLARLGTASGTVTDAVSGDPLSGICVEASGSSHFGQQSQTDYSGHYTVVGLDTDYWNLSFSDCNYPRVYANATYPETLFRHAGTRRHREGHRPAQPWLDLRNRN